MRPIFLKKGFLKRQLEDDSLKVINELLEVRNWSFHNAQSMLVADLENAKKSIPPELVGIAEIHPMLNPVIITRPKSYSRSMLEGFVHHNEEKIKQFDIVLMEMKKKLSRNVRFILYHVIPTDRIQPTRTNKIYRM